jgi:PiT family inorganic phosphate transporter
MYVASEALRLMKKNKQPAMSAADWAGLDNYKKHVDAATRFIPGWVKVAVAMALWSGHHDWMEADRSHSRREDR